MPPYNLLDEYENGWQAVRGNDVFYISTPSADRLEFGSSAVVPNRRRVRLFAALCVKHGELPRLDDPGVVPTDVAVGGKSEIAAYLWAIHRDHFIPESDRRPTELAAELDVSYDTVTTYCRRVLRSVSDRKVGGMAR
jgi:hypothetical protein